MPFLDPPWIVTAVGEGADDDSAAARVMGAAEPFGVTYVGDAPPPFGGINYLFFVFEFPAEAPTTPAGDPRDRLRSTVSEDLGSLLDAVEAIPVDLGFDIAYTNAVHQEPAVRTRYRELTRATDSPSVDVMVYPRPRQNTMMEEQFDGVTLLSRLAAWYPPKSYGTVTELGIPNDGGTSTTQQVITGLLTQWAALQPWITFKPVPDLRLPTGGTYDTPGEGRVTTDTVTLAQEVDDRSTALDILHDLLSPFPGTVVRQDSEGDLVIVPVYGPDADTVPAVTIRPFDAYSVSTGKPDPFTTINRATFTAVGGRTRSDDVEVMQPAWFQVGSNYRLGNSAGWFTPPNDCINLQPPRQGDDVLQESLVSGQFGLQKPDIWPVSADAIPAGTGIGLRNSVPEPTISTMWRVFGPGGGFAFDGPGTITQVQSIVPFDGTWGDLFRLRFDMYHLYLRGRWNANAGGIELSFGSATFEANCWAGCWTAIVEITLNDSSTAYAEAGQTSITFGLVENGDSLPSETGGNANAIRESQDAFGVRERTITVRGYALDAATLTAAARGYVLHNITPRVTREAELSLGAQGVVFDTIGRLVELPSGERGILSGLTYSDEFTSGAWGKTARVQLRDMTGPGAIPPNPFENAITDSSGVVLTDTSGAPITVTLGGE